MDTYEQKYKEALKVIESLYNIVKYQSSSDALLICQTIEKAFPELRESEDERIRKCLITFFKIFPYDSIENAGTNAKEAIAWLEKQGEQEPVKFDKNCYHNDGLYYAIDILEKTLGKVEGYQSDDEIIKHQTAIETVNALYHKKPAEWSEEDEKFLNYAISLTDDAQIKNFLKSLKPNHWKSS